MVSKGVFNIRRKGLEPQESPALDWILQTQLCLLAKPSFMRFHEMNKYDPYRVVPQFVS